MKLLISITALTVCCASPTFAAVNMMTAGLSKTYQDPIGDIRRTYNSRSLYRGYFGYGWCSDLEYRLEAKDGIRRLIACDQTLPVDMLDPSVVRLIDGRELTFDQKGRLVGYKSASHNFLLIWSSLEKPVGILRYGTTPLRIKWDPRGERIRALQDSENHEIRYSYLEQDLSSVSFDKQNKFIYRYDKFHNLTQVSFPDGTSEQFTYDNSRDWVLRVKHRDNCEDEFKYVVTVRNSHVTKATRVCAAKLVKSVEHSYNSPVGGL